MKCILWTAVLVTLASPAFADSTYDWQSGNIYNYYTAPDGDTTVNGYNLNSGSSWNTRIQSDGDMSGVDSQGNYWNYDSGSGYYSNSDGTLCIGKGAARVCN